MTRQMSNRTAGMSSGLDDDDDDEDEDDSAGERGRGRQDVHQEEAGAGQGLQAGQVPKLQRLSGREQVMTF